MPPRIPYQQFDRCYMYAATRILMNARKPFSRFPLTQVKVRQIGGGKPGDCFGNASDAIDRLRGIKIVAGWMVSKFNPHLNSTEITAHYWNVLGEDDMFDISPVAERNVEYVVDQDLSIYGQENYNRYSSMVWSSLLLRDNRFWLVNGDHNTGLSYQPAQNLSNEELFRDLLISK